MKQISQVQLYGSSWIITHRWNCLSLVVPFRYLPPRRPLRPLSPHPIDVVMRLEGVIEDCTQTSQDTVN